MKSKILNICIITRITSHHSFGGMQHYIDLLACGLAERGNNVFILTTALSKAQSSETVIKQNGNISTFFIANTRPGSYRNGFLKKAYKQFVDLNKNHKIDLIHGQSASALGFVGKVDVPVITTLFGVGYSETPFQKLIFPKLDVEDKLRFLLKFPKIAVSIKLMYKAAFGSDKVILISKFSQREFLNIKPNFPQDKIEVINCGIENEMFGLHHKSKLKKEIGVEGPMVLSAGRVEVQKGVHLLLEAWSKINIGNAQLIIIGDGSYLPKLKKMAEALSLKNCRFTGKLPHSEFLKYFGAADVFVYPELTKPAFGLVAAQAMAHGAPVIGSNHGAIPEVIGDAGFVFEPGNSSSLAKKVDYFLNNCDMWGYLSEKCQLRVKCFFTESEMVKRTLNLYWDIIKQKRKS